MWNMADQQMKYAEVMAVAGGVTSVQVRPLATRTPGTACCRETLSCTILVAMESIQGYNT